MLRPLGDRVIVKPDEAESVTPGGIVLPDNAKEKPSRGKILAVGPGKFENGQRVPVRLAAGEAVLYSKYAGTAIEVDNEEVYVLREDDVLAVIE